MHKSFKTIFKLHEDAEVYDTCNSTIHLIAHSVLSNNLFFVLLLWALL